MCFFVFSLLLFQLVGFVPVVKSISVFLQVQEHFRLLVCYFILLAWHYIVLVGSVKGQCLANMLDFNAQ